MEKKEERKSIGKSKKVEERKVKWSLKWVMKEMKD